MVNRYLQNAEGTTASERRWNANTVVCFVALEKRSTFVDEMFPPRDEEILDAQSLTFAKNLSFARRKRPE